MRSLSHPSGVEISVIPQLWRAKPKQSRQFEVIVENFAVHLPLFVRIPVKATA